MEEAYRGPRREEFIECITGALNMIVVTEAALESLQGKLNEDQRLDITELILDPVLDKIQQLEGVTEKQLFELTGQAVLKLTKEKEGV